MIGCVGETRCVPDRKDRKHGKNTNYKKHRKSAAFRGTNLDTEKYDGCLTHRVFGQ
jgi:hypothetical protein